MHVAPPTKAVWMPMPRPKPWNTGITESIFIPSMGEKPLAAMVWSARALKLRLLRRMPLVVPVVPPE